MEFGACFNGSDEGRKIGMNARPENNWRVLVMVAVEAEKDAVLRGLRRNTESTSGGDGGELASGAAGRTTVDVELAGVGPAMAAARTTRALIRAEEVGRPYDLVISAGIGGGFVGRARIGSLVVANDIVAADLGAETGEGFLSVDQLGFGSARSTVNEAAALSWADALRSAELEVTYGPVLTVSTATGTAATEAARAARVTGAAAEGMEGFGIAVAAQEAGVHVIEIRAISNAVGPRDRNAWRIGDALAALEAAFAVFPRAASSSAEDEPG